MIWRHSSVNKLQKLFGCCLHGLLRCLHDYGLKKKTKAENYAPKPKKKKKQLKRVRQQSERFVNSSVDKIIIRNSSLIVRTSECLFNIERKRSSCPKSHAPLKRYVWLAKVKLKGQDVVRFFVPQRPISFWSSLGEKERPYIYMPAK